MQKEGDQFNVTTKTKIIVHQHLYKSIIFSRHEFSRKQEK